MGLIIGYAKYGGLATSSGVGEEPGGSSMFYTRFIVFFLGW